jgi:hypothetical protein
MKTRAIASAVGLAAVLSTLCLTAGEASAQVRVYGGARVVGPRVLGGALVRPRVYGPYGGYVAPRVYGGVYGPRVYVTGPVLAPPVLVGPPAVAVAPAPVYAAPPPVMITTRPLMPPPEPLAVWGVGVRGLFVGEHASNAGGIGGHIRFRTGRWAGFEVSADYLRVDVAKTTRQDVPVMAALMLYLLPGRFAPYVLAGGGVNFAHASFANGLSDRAEQIAAQAGGGLELRLNRHIALTADLRYIYRARLGDNRESSPAVQNIGTEHGAQLLVGGTFYF